jgi:predicted lipase
MKTFLSILLASWLIVSIYSYSSPLALELAYMSEVAYEDSAKIESWTCKYCPKYQIQKPKVFSNSAGGVQGFVGFSTNLKSIIVSFRGSSNIKNWISNLNAARTTYAVCSGCQVHSGFNSAYNLVKNDLHSLVEQYTAMFRGSRIMVTGHSLGGALAILAASDFITLYGKVDEVYTFGQPRVGNAAFGLWYQQKVPQTYRLIHYADIVPHLPPSNLGFVHSNYQIWYTEDMQHFQQCAP